ncbi:MAG: hypothetical protein EOP66_03875 [Sphingomonas sp.]|nr:MAG: hypothetical protein EOP66_03875 [Sphingomonas sp.]
MKKIDIDNPYFVRRLTRRRSSGCEQCVLQLWLPVQMDNGGWMSAVHITGLDLPEISAMPGSDPLDALLQAVAFARNVIDHSDGRFLFSDAFREGGALPVSLNRGFAPRNLADIEAQAALLADDAFRRRQEDTTL